jgi:hypothetical protein
MNWFKRLFSSSAEAETAAAEDGPTHDEGGEVLHQSEEFSGGAAMPGLAGPEGAGAAEAELSEYDRPTDLAP